MMDLLCLSSLAGSATAGMDSDKLQTVKSECSYYHYCCDGIDDRGWGCGYRSLQSLCSWVVKCRPEHFKIMPPRFTSPPSLVPDIGGIQSCLVEVGDKPSSFIGSKEWIGCYEASIVLDHLYGVSCRIVHVSSGSGVLDQIDVLDQHFKQVGSPVMIGGNVDGASKTLIGISVEVSHPERMQFLIADPHYQGVCDSDVVLSERHVSWHLMELFQNKSFYNFCLPLAL